METEEPSDLVYRVIAMDFNPPEIRKPAHRSLSRPFELSCAGRSHLQPGRENSGQRRGEAQTVLNPQTECSQRDDSLLAAAGMAAHQYLALADMQIEELGLRSSCAGQRAAQPPPAFRPPRALVVFSAFMERLLAVGGGGLAGSVRRGQRLGPRPLGEERKKAGDVLGDLPGVLAGQITPDARLPDLAGAVDQIAVC
jgi:hypothetical protein